MRALAASLALLLPAVAFGQHDLPRAGKMVAPVAAKKALAEVERKYGFKIVWDQKFDNGVVKCDPVREGSLSTAASVLQHLEAYPASFIQAIPLREVVLCRNLLRSGNRANGVAYRAYGQFFMVAGTPADTFHHELFHIADGVRPGTWKRIHDYKYEGSERFFGHGRGRATGTLDTSLQGFLTDYGRASPLEDRADTFMLLMTAPRAVADRAEQDAVVRRKVEFIKAYVEGLDSAMDDDFWRSR